jgi:SulP family sulfate permease
MHRQGGLSRDALAGAVVSLVAISFYLSSAALIFQGPLAEHLANGIGAALFGGALLALFAAYKGSIGLSSVGPEPATVPILASMSAGIAAQCSSATVLPTLVMALTIAALCIGLTWYLMGRFGVGNVIRYIPYPVIGGFLAGIGWLMLSGGIGVVAGKPFSMALVQDMLAHGPSAQIVVGLAMGCVFWLATQKSKHVILLPALIVFFSLLVHAALAGNSLNLEQARTQGWLMRAFATALPANPLSFTGLAQVEWGVIAHQSGTILSAMIVSIIALLLSDSSLEVAFDERADFNRDLKVLGLGNVALSLCGGLAGGISISRSLLNKESGAVSRWSGVVKAAICLLAMFVGGPVIALIPKAVLGGILIYIGIGMLKTWLFDSRKRLTTSDYIAVLIMVCLTVSVGYLPAVVVGIVVCCFDFAISSARLVTVRRSFTRNEWPDKVERSAAESAILETRGGNVRIVELQGALFFGSIRSLAYDMEKLLTGQPGLEKLVIDFRRVPWIDSSGAQAMSRVVKLSAKYQARLSLSGVSAPVLKMLQTNGCFSAQGPEVSVDIDHALLDWDDQTIRDAIASPSPLEDWLQSELGSASLVQRLKNHLLEIQLTPGDVLFSQGEAADTLYLVQHGRLTARLEVQHTSYKVRSIQAGGTVGEMGLYRGANRSATVGADEPATVLALTKAAMHSIEAQDPTLAMALHKLFVRLLARRLDHANAQARALSL